MGNKASHEKANVVVSLREDLCRLDTLRVSYRGGGCLRRRRQIASFTFPSTGWWSAEGIAACEAEGGLSVPLAALKKKDGSRTVQLRCSSGRRTLLKAAMTLGKFIDSLEFLHFSLHCDSRDSRVAYTSMRCNGHRCVEAARRTEANGVKDVSAPTKATTTPPDDAREITKASVIPAGDARPITKDSATEEGDDSHITMASTTEAGGDSHITKASTTEAGDDSHITKASTTEAGDDSSITKASTTEAGDDSHITKASTTEAGDDSHITKASTTEAGDESPPTSASGNKVNGVKEAGVVMTQASNCEVNDVRETSGTAQDSTNQSLRRRKVKKPKRSARRRDTVIPRRHAAPYTWTNAFVDVTAICAVVVSGVLAYYTCC